MNKKLLRKYLKEMQICVDRSKKDEMTAHIEADELLCDLLISIGYKELVDKWLEVDKWFS